MPVAMSVFAEGLDHPECVAVHPDGSVWCGGEAGQIYRIGMCWNKTKYPIWHSVQPRASG
jgi:hypothetical protein